jgi:hypothetical protein
MTNLEKIEKLREILSRVNDLALDAMEVTGSTSGVHSWIGRLASIGWDPVRSDIVDSIAHYRTKGHRAANPDEVAELLDSLELSPS